jgi:DNA-binding GntR family transcriptional regulator
MTTSELANRISNRVVQDILSGDLASGSHVRTQQIADRYQVSRTPVRDALVHLQEIGFLEHFPNRGYFVSENIPKDAIEEAAENFGTDSSDYQQFAEDWLTDRLPEVVTEQTLRQKYDWTKARLTEMLARAAREGWAERKEGYGWRLLPVAKNAEAFDEIYRFRMAIEPAALLEPGFEINREALEEQKRIQSKMLDSDIATTPVERLLDNGANFHEIICQMSHNPFFVTALERVNRMRRLMEYRSRVDRERLTVQCTEHLELIELLQRGEIAEASYFMRRHLSGALKRKSPVVWDWTSGSRQGSEVE